MNCLWQRIKGHVKEWHILYDELFMAENKGHVKEWHILYDELFMAEN